MEVVIAGAGIGGLALARGLMTRGHAVRVLERSPAWRDGGAAVTVFSNGAAAAAGSGVRLDDLGGLIDELEMCGPGGDRIGMTDLRVLRRRTGFAVRTITRGELLARLGDGVEVEHGREITGVRVTHGHAVAVDATGAEHRADVLVGADGHRSAVRRLVLDPSPATENGWVSVQGLTTELPELAAGTRARCFVGAAGLCGLMPAGQGRLMWWFDTRAPVTDLRERFRAYGGPVAHLLETITAAQTFAHVLHRVPDRWGTGPVTLLGDAAHAFPPSQAQGANQALEDAWLLTRHIESPDGLRRYERERARRVRLVSRMAGSEMTNKPPNALARLAGRIMPPAVAGHAYLALIRRFSSILST